MDALQTVVDGTVAKNIQSLCESVNTIRRSMAEANLPAAQRLSQQVASFKTELDTTLVIVRSANQTVAGAPTVIDGIVRSINTIRDSVPGGQLAQIAVELQRIATEIGDSNTLEKALEALAVIRENVVSEDVTIPDAATQLATLEEKLKRAKTIGALEGLDYARVDLVEISGVDQDFDEDVVGPTSTFAEIADAVRLSRREDENAVDWLTASVNAVVSGCIARLVAIADSKRFDPQILAAIENTGYKAARPNARGPGNPVHEQATRLAVTYLAPSCANRVGVTDALTYRTALLGGLRVALGSTSSTNPETVILRPGDRKHDVLLDFAIRQASEACAISLFGYQLVTDRQGGKITSFDADRITIGNALEASNINNTTIRELAKIPDTQQELSNDEIYEELAALAELLVRKLGGSFLRKTHAAIDLQPTQSNGDDDNVRPAVRETRQARFDEESTMEEAYQNFKNAIAARDGPKIDCNRRRRRATRRWAHGREIQIARHGSDGGQVRKIRKGGRLRALGKRDGLQHVSLVLRRRRSPRRPEARGVRLPRTFGYGGVTHVPIHRHGGPRWWRDTYGRGRWSLRIARAHRDRNSRSLRDKNRPPVNFASAEGLGLYATAMVYAEVFGSTTIINGARNLTPSRSTAGVRPSHTRDRLRRWIRELPGCSRRPSKSRRGVL